ncbi:pentatricopeptide repeat-containing protein At3g04130, mitochondrial [Mercurialis annua]|uniref:pentatricopeptide repeat-containing protein At3g04130, mitochondrial n=1 Tax=Mercurialis annua TaxID=3986 RepID=UPI0021602D47|nr:pentatricopeptide repeat-containing protein At3g04130, mitochondrial [Mercurialis annua]
MASLIRNSLRTTSAKLIDPSFSCVFYHASFHHCSPNFSTLFAPSPPIEEKLESFPSVDGKFDKKEQSLDSPRQYNIDILVSKFRVGSSPDEILESLVDDELCDSVHLSHELVEKLLFRFKDDWKSALGVFRWVELRAGYKHKAENYDTMVDILGKMKQMDQMRVLLEEMERSRVVTLKTVGKAMRRFSGAGQWENAVRMFDKLESFGLEKNTESMNLLLDTLCKERKVEQAREIFLKLKSHISPDANTFNIFIHGWCKVNRVEEADWTIQEMKGHGCVPCVISYSTIIQFYCHRCKFSKVYEILDEMEAQGLIPNVVTYTTVMSALAKSEEYGEALQIAHRMKSVGCKPDALFYNSLIHTLGRAGKPEEAVRVFEVEMPNAGVSPNTSTYNTMIAMLCYDAQERRALNLLKKMETSMICKPDVQTYYPLLKSCFRTGKIDCLLSQLLDDMVKKHHLSLDISAYTLLVHGLCRANRCEWAYRLFEEMLGKDMTPKYQTCRLLLDEVKLKHMYDAAQRIEIAMQKI